MERKGSLDSIARELADAAAEAPTTPVRPHGGSDAAVGKGTARIPGGGSGGGSSFGAGGGMAPAQLWRRSSSLSFVRFCNLCSHHLCLDRNLALLRASTRTLLRGRLVLE